MSTWIKIGAVVLVAAALFLGGYRFAAALYQSDIDAMKADHALALAEKEKEHRANERKQTEALSAAWEEVERQKADLAQIRADSGNLRIELERVRQLADRYRKRLPAAGASTCKHFAVRLDRCVGLLSEGSGLASEGAELSQRLSGKHDALARIYK